MSTTASPGASSSSSSAAPLAVLQDPDPLSSASGRRHGWSPPGAASPRTWDPTPPLGQRPVPPATAKGASPFLPRTWSSGWSPPKSTPRSPGGSLAQNLFLHFIALQSTLHCFRFSGASNCWDSSGPTGPSQQHMAPGSANQKHAGQAVISMPPTLISIAAALVVLRPLLLRKGMPLGPLAQLAEAADMCGSLRAC